MIEEQSFVNKSGSSVKRCDAALSSDGNYLIIWAKMNNGNIQYSRYDFAAVNNIWATSSSKAVSFKTDSNLKSACQSYVLQNNTTRVFPQSSFQGIELTNNYNMYIASGVNTTGVYPWICKLSKTGTWLTTVQMSFGQPYGNFEIEGVKIVGSYLYFGAHYSNGNGICRILKSALD